jgi:hypothetical protein
MDSASLSDALGDRGGESLSATSLRLAPHCGQYRCLRATRAEQTGHLVTASTPIEGLNEETGPHVRDHCLFLKMSVVGCVYWPLIGSLGIKGNLEILKPVSRKNLRLCPDERGCPNQASRRERMSMPRSERRANGADCEPVHIRNSWGVGRAHPAAGPLAAASGGATPPARHSLGRKCWPFTQLALSPDSQFAVLRAPVPT